MSARILLVDDEVSIALQIESALEAEGFEVVGSCRTVSQALDFLGNPDSCDAVVLDANLRNESAQPIARALAGMRKPFVVVSGYSPHQLPPEFTAAPILGKPIHTDELITQLRAVLLITGNTAAADS